MKLLLSKLEVMAIRGEDWLFSIITPAGHISDRTVLDEIAARLRDEARPKTWIGRLFYTEPTDNRFIKQAYLTDEWKKHRLKEKIYKKMLWNTTRDKYKMIHFMQAGSFDDHYLIIEDLSTGIKYDGRCNNYGGDNPIIQFNIIP